MIKEQIKAIIKQYADKSMNNFHKALKDDGEEAATTKYWDGFSSCANLLLLEIDSIQKEPINEDLEKFINTIKLLTSNTALLTFEYGCREGANWQKQQMMKNAVSGHIGQTVNGILRVLSDEVDDELGFEAGDKVKVIIIKEADL